MKKFILPACILALPTIIYYIIGYASYDFYNNNKFVISISQFFVNLSLIFYFVRKYKLAFNNGVIAFGTAFKYAFKIVLCWAVLASVLNLCFDLLNDDFHQKLISDSLKVQEQHVIEKNGSITASQQQLLEKIARIESNPLVLCGISIVSFLFYGTLNALITAGILKTKPE